MKQKIITDRQLKSEFLLMLIVTSLISGMAFCHAGRISGLSIFTTIGLVCKIVNIASLVIPVIAWGIRNQIYRGVKYAFLHYKMVFQLRKQLLDANIYTIKRFGSTKFAKIPNIKINFESDFQNGNIFIKNSIKYHNELSKIDISPSLGAYVVEQIYLADDENHYRYDIYNATLVRRLTFKNMEEFKAYSDSANRYELFIDRYTKLPLTHQLLVGQTGSGKTYALHGYLLQMISKPMKYNLYFADMKSSSVALLGEQISPENTADNFEEIVKLLERFVAKLKKRQLIMKEHLRKKIDGDYRDFQLVPYILIFDEFADFSLFLQTQDKKQRDHVNSLISSIILKGRQLGCFLWVVMQQAGSNNIPTYVRDNLPLKVVLGNAERQTYVTTFGADAEIPLREMRLGDGVYTYPAIANKPKLCEFPTFEFDILDILQK